MIYSEPNSFFQLEKSVFFNCSESFDMCFPVYNLFDLTNYGLLTDDNPMPDINNRCEVPKTLYGYRIVTNCNQPAPAYTVNGYPSEITQYDTHQVKDNEWALKPVFTFQYNKLFESLKCDDCFYIQVIKTVTSCNDDFPEFGTPFGYTSSIIGCIGCFKKICDPCYTTLIEYSCNENAFGFYYKGIGNNFLLSNKIRLPFYLKEPQFPTTRRVFTLSNGMEKKLSSRIKKEWNLETDFLPKEWHEKLVVALEHDDVTMVNTNANLNSLILMDGDYQIEWPGVNDYPLAKAKCKVKQIPYKNINSNCQ